jgi:hypothetical protein
MLLKDYRKRPSASKLKTLLMKSEYYDKLYSSPKSRNTRLELLRRSRDSDSSNNTNSPNNSEKDSRKLSDICITDVHGEEYKIPKLNIGDGYDDII